MCITKSKDNIRELFDRHTIDELDYTIVDQKQSHWFTDMTTKRAFIEHDTVNGM